MYACSMCIKTYIMPSVRSKFWAAIKQKFGNKLQRAFFFKNAIKNLCRKEEKLCNKEDKLKLCSKDIQFEETRSLSLSLGDSLSLSLSLSLSAYIYIYIYIIIYMYNIYRL